MPIYEYACKACGYEFETWQKISDKPVRTCPSCKKRKVEKLVSMSSFQLKGGGWYADGYAKTNATSKSDDSSKSDSSSKSEGNASSTESHASSTASGSSSRKAKTSSKAA
ncbi:MAG: FmdB family transcriptional regulator [Proteobacteria bacterium]|nr:MAG: FmdB family transcriptional regulator [Pseudomonadota bacterium]